ncbi:MAG: hypothetical protein ABIJ40_06660 [Bacteroidota bacterium]
MKAKDLAELLLENPEFNVEMALFEKDSSDWSATLRRFEINGIADIGYSDKIIILDIIEDK